MSRPARIRAYLEVPAANLRIPDETDFVDLEKDDPSAFLAAPGLALLGWELLNRSADLAQLADFSVTYLWRRKGGKSRGQLVYGRCQKPSGVLKHAIKSDFVVSLSADHCRDNGFGPQELTALLFHELLHISVGEDGKPKLVGHDFEGFTREIAEFGLWRESALEMARAMQMALFEEGEK